MPDPVRILVVEDSDDDATLLLRAVEQSGLGRTHLRVRTPEAMRAALDAGGWDLVVCDVATPKSATTAALEILRESAHGVPFVIVGHVGRLLPAVERARADAGEALRTSEERFRTLIESMHDMVFTLDAEQRHDSVFGGWPKAGSLSPGRVIGQSAREALGAADGEVHETAAARALAGHRTIYEWSLKLDGDTRYFQTSLSPRRDAAGAVIGVVGVHHEVTDDKRVQAQLVSSDRLASVGLLAASVGHEINNPLASLLANLELADRDIQAAADAPRFREAHEALSDARDAAVRIREIVRDLRLFSRETEEQGHLDLLPVLESSLRMARTEIRHRARLVTELSPVPAVEASHSRLGQVFLNLIVNAAQAIDDSGVDANEIRVSARTDPEGWAVVEIADSGCGIPREALGHLFTPFFTTKPEGIGTGLGLSICKRIVDALGGAIGVTSVVGKGSTFSVRLPPAGKLAAAAAAAKQGLVTASRRRGRVLVVDDERIVASAVVRILRREHDVSMTTSAHEALSMITRGERFDVVLCDLMMPEMTGMQLHGELERVAGDQAERMIFLTGGAFTDAARSFLERIPNKRLEKPFDVAALRALVNQRVR